MDHPIWRSNKMYLFSYLLRLRTGSREYRLSLTGLASAWLPSLVQSFRCPLLNLPDHHNNCPVRERTVALQRIVGFCLLVQMVARLFSRSKRGGVKQGADGSNGERPDSIQADNQSKEAGFFGHDKGSVDLLHR
jgi:hypothetical protein